MNNTNYVVFLLVLIVSFYNPHSIIAQSITYQYDEQNRLKSVNYGNGNTIIYDYDLNGNRTSKIITGQIVSQNIYIIHPSSNSINQPVNQLFKWSDYEVSLRQSPEITKAEIHDVKEIKNSRSREGGNSYWFELVSDTASLQNLIRDTTLSDTLKLVTGLNHEKDYFWRVRSKNLSGWNNFSEWSKFTTIVPPLITASYYPELRSSMSYTLGMTNLTIESNIMNAATVTASFYNKPPVETNLPGGLTSISQYYWTIQDSGIIFSNGKIKIPLSSLGGITNPSNLRWLKRPYSSDDWENIGGEIIDGNLVSTVLFDSFSEFAIASTDEQPLQSSYYSVKVIPQGLYNPVSLSLNRRDTVNAYLYNVSLEKVDSAVSLIDSINFTAIFDFKHALTGTYYIVIKHHNSLETWSKAGGESFERFEVMYYDFTFQQGSAYGNNLIHVDAVWCLLSGDVNQDGVINALDRASCWNLRNQSGYFSEDINGDGIVNALDRGIIWNNRNASVQIPGIETRPPIKSDEEVKFRNEIFKR